MQQRSMISVDIFQLSIILFLVLFLNQVHSSDGEIKGKVRFKLIHRHSPELGESNGTNTLGPPSNQRERIKQLVHSDIARIHRITQKLGNKIRMTPDYLKTIMGSNKKYVELPMRSAADIGEGQYFVSIRVGSPPKKFLLLTDTGSSVTWIKCKYLCDDCYKDIPNMHERLFYPNNSRSFKSIPCTSSVCTKELEPDVPPCEITTFPCNYQHSYMDGTKMIGTYGYENVKIRLRDGRKIKLTDVVIGCSESIATGLKIHEVDGILGLGLEPASFSMKAAKMFGNKFSYCLVDHMTHSNVVNFLQFGEVDDPPPNMQYTQLLLPSYSHYQVNISGISVDGKMLDIPPSTWDIKNGGTIIDSGASLTYLAKPAYDKVFEAFQAPLSKFKKIQDEALGPLCCFDNTGFNDSLMPKLAIHFADGAKFSPPVKSYIIDDRIFDGKPTVKCLGFSSVGWPGQYSLIGNIMQQNHLWEYDLRNARIGFAPSSCIHD